MGSDRTSPVATQAELSAPSAGDDARIRTDPRLPALVALVLAALALILYRSLESGNPLGTGIGQLVLLVAPLAAAGALLAAASVAARRRLAPWIWFAIAAMSGAAAQGVAMAQPLGSATGELPPLYYFLSFAVHLFFVGGVLAALLRSGRDAQNRETLLELPVIAVLLLIAFFRFGVEPVWQSGPPPPDALLTTVVTAGCMLSLCAAALLMLWRGAVLPPRCTALLAAAAAAFALAQLMTLAGAGTGPARPDPWPSLVQLGGWASLGLAGLFGAGRENWVILAAAPSPITERLRRWIMPATSFLLGAAALDAVLRPAGPGYGLALLALGTVLGMRTMKAILAAEKRIDERLEIAHTRALAALSRDLAAVRNLERTLDLVADWTRRALSARAALIELVTEDGHTLELRASSGLPPSVVGLRFAVSESFTGWVVRTGRSRATTDPGRDPTVQPQSLPFLGRSPTAAAPLRTRQRTVGALVAIRDDPFDPEALRLLQVLADRAAISIENAQLFEQVEALSLTDPLTGLANRRQLERDLEREFAAARRGRRLVAVLLDLDDFKSYNDHFGHLAGDEALRLVGDILAAEMRTMNLAARYGGDEFVVLLADTDLEGAETLTDRIRERVRRDSVVLGHQRLSMTAGLAEYTHDMEKPFDLIAAADRALYRAKNSRATR